MDQFVCASLSHWYEVGNGKSLGRAGSVREEVMMYCGVGGWWPVLARDYCRRCIEPRCITVFKENQNTPRPSEHPPVMRGKMSKRLGGIKRLQIQNLFMAFKQVPRCR